MRLNLNVRSAINASNELLLNNDVDCYPKPCENTDDDDAESDFIVVGY